MSSPTFSAFEVAPCLLAHMKLFTPSQALLGRGGGSYPSAWPFKWPAAVGQSSSTLWWW